jgi:D-alanine--poly(phosphoribitol) ligase subunit 1
VIKLGSIAQFLEAVRVRIQPVSADRISQTSELSFDVSVFEMFLAWGSGASVHVVPATQLMSPSRFITDHGLTIWSSVPSIAAFMRGMKTLKPGAFPSLRYSVFCGEALPYPLAEAWQAAAPWSIVENLYGPTEATVGCVSATVGPEFPATPTLNLVPSGLPLPGVEAAVVDESFAFLPVGEVGQLVLAGGQLAEGYYNEPELNRERFPVIDGKRWYLTGDLTRQDEHGAFHHLGRMDRQIKLMGQRVELEEIEAHLRSVCNSDNVAAVAWPIEDGLVQGVVGFTSGASKPSQELLETLRRRLPSYMVPRRIVQLDELPHTANGKIDRNALALSLNESPSLCEEAS